MIQEVIFSLYWSHFARMMRITEMIWSISGDSGDVLPRGGERLKFLPMTNSGRYYTIIPSPQFLWKLNKDWRRIRGSQTRLQKLTVPCF